MGLLQKLSDNGLDTPKQETPVLDKPVANKKSNSVGLLKKSLMASENRRLDFFEFTGKYNLKICALLKSQNGTYRITDCIGLDGKSICLSTSTADFWNGTIESQDKLYTFGNNDDARAFCQFFTPDSFSLFKTINIIRTKNNSIFFICNAELDFNSDLISDLEAVENTETSFETNNNSNLANSYSYKIDFAEALESFILSDSNHEAYFSKVILKELYYNLCLNFPEPSKLLYSDKGSFTLFTDENLPAELLYNHIKIESTFIIGQHAELLSVENNNSL